jgi:hypothetical protein
MQPVYLRPLPALTPFPRRRPRSEQVLVDLPNAALYATLHTAGPRLREICRALLDLYGPLPRLTPGEVETPAELLSALATHDNRHLHLSELDLTHVPDAVTDSCLLALYRALPNLCTLHLPATPYRNTLSHSIAAATAQLPNLTALHVPYMADGLREWCIAEGCATHLQELTLLSAVLEQSNAALSCLTRLSKLCLTGLHLNDLLHIVPLVAQLPALVVFTLEWSHFDTLVDLRSLTQLTALKLEGTVGERLGAQELEHVVGSLTHLRSLVLELYWLGFAEPACLAQLTMLTSLRLHVAAWCAADLASSPFEEVASSVPLLPALRELCMTAEASTRRGTFALSDDACACIASARSSLGLLYLENLTLPGSMLSEVLPQLTRLTCLRLSPTNPIKSFDWLPALTALRELRYTGCCQSAAASTVMPCHLLTRLSTVTTLSLAWCSFLDGPYLQQLCAHMPQLRTLDLGHNDILRDGLSALQHLTNLEVLGLSPDAGKIAELLGNVSGLPASLRRCYVGLGNCSRIDFSAHEKQVVQAMLGKQVQAVFDWWEAEH